MKITRAKFVNFIGFDNGLSKKEIEINFNDDSKRIVMLVGGNGKGKSVLLYNLHPGSSSNDPKRKNIIIEGTDGRKEIDILSNGKLYQIVHLYPAKGNTKSFIDVTDELGVVTKLNPNGGVGTFIDIVERELGFTNDFFKVGRIAPDSNNFIDLISSERKKFISKFLPNIDCYLSIYDTVSDKIKGLKKELTVISDLITRIGDVSNLDEELEKKSTFLASALVNIEEITAEYNKMQGYKDSIDSEGILANGNPVAKELTEISDKIDKIEVAILNMKTRMPALAAFDLDMTNTRIEVNENESKRLQDLLGSFGTEISVKTECIRGIETSIVNAKDQLGTYADTGKSEGELVLLIEELKTKIDEFSKSLSSKSVEDSEKINNFDFRHIDAARVKANMVLEELTAINRDYGTDVIQLVVSTLSQPGVDPSNINHKASTLLEGLKLQLTEATKKRDFTSRRYEKFTDASKLTCPSGNKCPHWQHAQKFSSYGTVLEETNTDVNRITNMIDNAEENVKHLTEVKEAAQRVFKAYSSISTNKLMNLTGLRLYLISIKSFLGLMSLSSEELLKIFSFDSVIAFINARDNIDEYKSRLNMVTDNLNTLRKNSENILRIKTDIESLQSKLDIEKALLSELQDKVSTTTVELNTSKKRVTVLEELRGLFMSANELIPTRDQLASKFSEYELKLRTYREYDKQQEVFASNLRSLKPEVSKISSEIDQLRVAKSKLEEYNDSYNKINASMSKLILVKNAVDPVRGIPVHLTKEYLKDIVSLCNDFLDIAYNGSFRINDFVISDKEFLVPITKNGKQCKDISEASQGETSLTKIALSFAMFCQIIKNYNILYLDEADGPLDTHNKKIFMEILDRQIQDLKLEQVFVISHNNEFYSSEVSLILFPEHNVNLDDETFMINKTLVSDLSA